MSSDDEASVKLIKHHSTIPKPLYKIINNNWNSFHYVIGRNDDIFPFNDDVRNTCCQGRIYSVEIKNLPRYCNIAYGDEIAIVTIPPDAKVVKEQDKYGSSSIIITDIIPFHKFWEDHKEELKDLDEHRPKVENIYNDPRSYSLREIIEYWIFLDKSKLPRDIIVAAYNLHKKYMFYRHLTEEEKMTVPLPCELSEHFLKLVPKQMHTAKMWDSIANPSLAQEYLSPDELCKLYYISPPHERKHINTEDLKLHEPTTRICNKLLFGFGYFSLSSYTIEERVFLICFAHTIEKFILKYGTINNPDFEWYPHMKLCKYIIENDEFNDEEIKSFITEIKCYKPKDKFYCGNLYDSMRGMYSYASGYKHTQLLKCTDLLNLFGKKTTGRRAIKVDVQSILFGWTPVKPTFDELLNTVSNKIINKTLSKKIRKNIRKRNNPELFMKLFTLIRLDYRNLSLIPSDYYTVELRIFVASTCPKEAIVLLDRHTDE